MQNTEPAFEEVLDSNQVLKTPLSMTLVFIAVIIFLYLFGTIPFGIEVNPYANFLIIPMLLIMVWLGAIHYKARKAFWKTVALKYGWNYSSNKDTSTEKGLLFQLGHSQKGSHSIEGSYLGQPFNIFEYSYTIGGGKSKSTYYLTVFEIKFNGTYPHIYLNYKKDWHNSLVFPYNMANITLPPEFAESFKLIAPKEYEIETLELFSPDLFQSLLDMGWDYDMEFIEGELVIYRKKTFSNFAELDAETNKVEKIIELLAPKLNKMKLTPIGDIPHTLI